MSNKKDKSYYIAFGDRKLEEVFERLEKGREKIVNFIN